MALAGLIYQLFSLVVDAGGVREKSRGGQPPQTKKKRRGPGGGWGGRFELARFCCPGTGGFTTGIIPATNLADRSQSPTSKLIAAAPSVRVDLIRFDFTFAKPAARRL